MFTVSLLAVVIPLALAFFVLLNLFTKSQATPLPATYRSLNPTDPGDLSKYYEMVLSENQDKVYLQRFLSYDGALSTMGFTWNWPAACFSVFWLFHRGMKLTAALIVLLLLVSAVLAPIKFTLTLWGVLMLVLGGSATRYFHFLLKQDIQNLLKQNLGDDAMRRILSEHWHSRFNTFDLALIALLLGLGVAVYFYEFESDDFSLDIAYPPSASLYPPELNLDVKPELDDLKAMLQGKVHKDSFAYLFLEQLNAEKSPERQREFSFIVDAALGQGNPQAQYLKGRMQLTGYPGTPRNTRAAIGLLGKSAIQGHKDALLQLSKLAYSRGINPDEREETRVYLGQAAAKGSTVAGDLLGQLDRIPPGAGARDRGMANLIALAGQGDEEARNALLDKVRTEQAKKNQSQLALELLNASALENPVAQHVLGLAYQNGYLGLPNNIEIAAGWYRLGADKGLTDSIIELGKLYHTDKMHNPEEAAYWLARANAPGQEPVRKSFKPLAGHESRVPSPNSGVALLLSQAKAGDKASLDTLMDKVAHEEAPNSRKAIVIDLLKAAASDNTVAQHVLGYAYQNGYLGLERDDPSALLWYHQAAANGQVESQLALGKHYGMTREEPGHLVKARFWLGKAAKAGAPEAKTLLKQYSRNTSGQR
ncbi:sel1 repeat family protein [Candidatus Kaiserbacteria bacterium]|nr:sel1 repeat family protein [Candidatus Kaiserbacteria bacterium]